MCMRTIDNPFLDLRNFNLEGFSHFRIGQVLTDVLECQSREREESNFALELRSRNFCIPMTSAIGAY